MSRKLEEVRLFLESNIRDEAETSFGNRSRKWLRRATANWFDDHRNYDGRWKVIEARGAAGGRVLDMAAGCGTFVLYGLHQGHDVVGIDPEDWKREYFCAKIEASGYPNHYRERVIAGVGESLPFPDSSFGLVTTYQTLEHVSDVDQCLKEMVRVLSPGGVLYIRAPDYRTLWEAHYRLPLLPAMSPRMARAFLNLMRRPLAGLSTLNWITEPGIVRSLRMISSELEIERATDYYRATRHGRFVDRLPALRSRPWLLAAACAGAEARQALMGLVSRIWKEGTIDLWVTKPD